MRKTSLLFAGVCVGVITISLSWPQCSRAGGLGEPGPNIFQNRNPGSYSACHYWTPALYRWRAYHNPARLYDQAEWDGGGSFISGSACSTPATAVPVGPPPAPASLPPAPVKKADGQK
jgi:hypothetical protein